MAYMVSDHRPDPFEKVFMNQRSRYTDAQSIPINIKEVISDTSALMRPLQCGFSASSLRHRESERLSVTCRQPRPTSSR